MDDDDLLRQLVDEIRKDQKEIVARLAALEGFRWMIIGGMSVITVMIVPLLLDVFIGLPGK